MVVGLDTETSGLSHQHDFCFGVSLRTETESYYWDLRRQPQAIGWLNENLDRAARIVAHNVSFDYRMLSKAGVRTTISKWDDTCIRACLIDEWRRNYTLDDLCLQYLGRGKVDIWPSLATLFGGLGTRNVQAKNLVNAPYELVAEYAKPDAELCLLLWWWQQERIEAEGLQKICEFERRLMPIVIEMESRGIRVDIDAAVQAMEDLTPIIAQKQDRLQDLTNESFNANSPPQVKALYQIDEREGEFYIGDVQLGKTKKGKPSLGKDELQKLAVTDERAGLVLEIRSLLKTRDTFLGGHILGSAHRGRVYPSIHQNKNEAGGTGTGRFAYTGPALQQIPSRNKQVAEIVKRIFLPEEGHKWVDGDLDGFEVRCFCHLVGNPRVLAEYKRNPELDFHQYVADATNLPRSPTYEMKASAKTLNLSAIFNRGNGAIARDMGYETTRASFTNGQGKVITYQKAPAAAMAIIDRYHMRVPGIKKLAADASRIAKDKGYIKTWPLTRHIHVDPEKLYKASGLLIQATSADKNKENVIKIHDTLEHGHLLLNTHDSYSMSIEEGHEEKEWLKVQAEVQNAGWRVPVLLTLSGIGDNWWDAINEV